MLKIAEKDPEHLTLLLGEIVTPRASVKQMSDKAAEAPIRNAYEAKVKAEITKHFYEELERVAGKELADYLTRTTLDGYGIRSLDGAYYVELNGGYEYTIARSSNKKTAAQHIYSIIAYKKGLIPTPFNEDQGYLTEGVPTWFTEKTELPQIVDLAAYKGIKKKWEQEKKKAIHGVRAKLENERVGFLGWTLYGTTLHYGPQFFYDIQPKNVLPEDQTINFLAGFVYFHTISSLNKGFVQFRKDSSYGAPTKNEILRLCREYAEKGSNPPEWFVNNPVLPEVS